MTDQICPGVRRVVAHRAWAAMGEERGGRTWIVAVYARSGDAEEKADLLDGTAPAGTSYWVNKVLFVPWEE